MGFLSSTLGIRLILWTGSSVPRPAPREALDALTRAEVNNDVDQGDGFQLTFTLSKDASRDHPLVASGALAPFTRVVVGVALGIVPEVLIDGVVTHHQVTPGTGSGATTLTVTGKDLTALMDLEEVNATYPNQPDSVIAARLLARYARHGVVPAVTPTTDVPIELQRVPRQQETDLRFLRRLAQRNGYVVYLEPLTFGTTEAWFGPEVRAGVPQPALTMDMGSHSNVKSLTFSNDALAASGTSGSFQEPTTKMSIPLPSLPSLRIPPFSAAPAEARRKRILRDTDNQSPSQAGATVVAAASTGPEPVSGKGEVSTERYGAVLRARRPVGVRGVGTRYDGFYYVRKVKHVITRDSYAQEFTLSREGTGSLTTVVRP